MRCPLRCSDEEPVVADPFESMFDSKESILAMMGIFPDENGFSMAHYEEDNSTVLYAYLGTAKTVIVPDGVEGMEMGCFSDLETLEEVILPASLKYFGEDCFENCPNLKKLVIPASVETIYDDDNTFDGCAELTVYTPACSVADRVVRAKNIPVVND